MALGAREHKTRLTIVGDDKTARAFGSAGKGLGRLQKNFRAMAVGVAAATAILTLGTVALGRMTKAAIENADSIAKVADKVGLGVESLQELRIAAELAGVEQNTLDMAMQRFSRRVGEAVQGQGELKDTLLQYGIAVTDAEGRTRALDDVLDDYADAIANAGSQQEALRLAFKAFDSEGAALVTLMSEGAAGLDGFRAEAQRLGLVLGEDMVRQAETANDALTRTSRIVGVNLQRVLISLAPLVERFGDAFAEAAPDILAAANALIRFFGGPELLALDALETEIDGLRLKIIDLDLAMGAMEDTNSRAFIGLEVEANLADAQVDRLVEIADRKRKLLKQLDDLGRTDEAAAQDVAAQRTRASALALLDSLREDKLKAANDDLALEESRFQKQLELIAFADLTFAERTEARIALVDASELRRTAILDAAADRNISAVDREMTAFEQRTAQAAIRMQALWKSGLQGQLQVTGSILGQLSGLMSSKSKKMFEVGKVAAIAGALIDTYKAATGAYAAMAFIPIIGPALGIAAAAAAIAAGLAQVQAIKSTSFGGGGGSGVGPAPAVGAGGGGGGTAPVPDVPTLGPPQLPVPAPRTISIDLSRAGMVTTDWIIDEFLPTLNDALGDGATIVVTA